MERAVISAADLALLATLLWCESTQLWSARARGSRDFHSAPTAEEAVRLALQPEEELW